MRGVLPVKRRKIVCIPRIEYIKDEFANVVLCFPEEPVSSGNWMQIYSIVDGHNEVDFGYYRAMIPVTRYALKKVAKFGITEETVDQLILHYAKSNLKMNQPMHKMIRLSRDSPVFRRIRFSQATKEGLRHGNE